MAQLELYSCYLFVILFHFQSYTAVMLVNPQKCLPYFTFQSPVYDGDDYNKVIDRVRRANQIPGISAIACYGTSV